MYLQASTTWGKLVRIIGQARATVARTMMATCYNLKRLAMFLHAGIDTFYKAASLKRRGARANGQRVRKRGGKALKQAKNA